MRQNRLLNDGWQFHLGEIEEPMKTVRKAAAIGGLAAPLENEAGDTVLIGAGGEHFLRLIAQGDREKGLRMLANTALESELDEDWVSVDLPHDWKNELPYVNDPDLLMSGSKPDGIAYYRKTFALTLDEVNEKQVTLHFMGVMRMASVWFNGVFLGDHYSGYSDFSFDVSELIRIGSEGVNVVLIKVDTTKGAEGWWYEGAGIYKDVYLEIKPKLQIVAEASFIETTEINQQEALLKITIGLANHHFEKKQKITIKSQVADQQNIHECNVDPLATTEWSYCQKICAPQLWSLENPHLYQATFQLFDGENQIDDYQLCFGIRTVAYTTKGFLLNGERKELRGVCEHQDFGGLGVALPKDILRYKLLKMKEMGVNAYRSAHHFASKDLLELCDELGIIVMNENRILESSEWRTNELVKMVKQTRNHPSLCFWSLCNEEVIGHTPLAYRMAQKLAAVIRTHTSQSLIVSAELLNPAGQVDASYMRIFDVNGVNYPESAVNGTGLVAVKEKYPLFSYLSTESASYFSTRGVYQDNSEKCHTSNFGSLYSMVLPGKRKPEEPGTGGTAKPKEVLRYLEEHAYMGGVFLWTFMDYYGEPAPFHWPGISSQFGITDTVGFEKDSFYYYQSRWTETPMVHVFPHWNKEGLTIDQGVTEVRTFSNCHTVELFLNGKSFGKKKNDKDGLSWHIPYEPGCLKAIGVKEEQTIEATRKTSGTTDSVTVKERFCGADYSLFEIQGIDSEGIEVPTADELVAVLVKNGTILGLANGDPADLDGYNCQEKKLFSGKLMSIIKKEPGKVPLIQAALKKGK